jgi:hypothetical protein
VCSVRSRGSVGELQSRSSKLRVPWDGIFGQPPSGVRAYRDSRPEDTFIEQA